MVSDDFETFIYILIVILVIAPIFLFTKNFIMESNPPLAPVIVLALGSGIGGALGGKFGKEESIIGLILGFIISILILIIF